MAEAKWRVRYSVIKLLANLSKEFGKDFYEKNTEELFLKSLTDSVAAVRDEGIDQINKLAKTFKADWVVNCLLPKSEEILHRDKIGYLYRISVLNAIVVTYLITNSLL